MVVFSASVLLSQAEELAAKYPNTIPVMLDVTSQEGHLESLVKDHDLVIRHGLHNERLNLIYAFTPLQNAKTQLIFFCFF